ncbi:DNA cytosine methyltransferase [Nocardia sp. CA2R105]|uniref:DNA cytosine methyltransferase n=1 Tax=Nocardia coffeae TaxID=2873381 RepID=UPI001CA74BD9|nr:DNA cytosine methyltransferase [Nocardia coffeae]MBY8861119.1 DNA cytosine methyltransferase [Nocardia coffeae]
MSLSVTDLFCGAGGSSTGLLQVPGFEVIVASNHWQLALDTHGANHPQIDHKRADIHSVDPLTFPRTEVLWASPECTNHSQAKGSKRNLDATPDLFGEILPDEAADRSRATMWDVPRFAERHMYQAIITENVVEASKWVMFPAWLQAMTLLGYAHRIVYGNSMHAQAGGLPAPQSRDRMYVVFWREGNRAPDLERWTRPSAYCVRCGETVSAIQSWKRPERAPWGRYRAQYVWRCPRTSCRNSVVEPGWLPAAAAIDWTLTGERIGDRAKPLAAKTITRIQAGLAKFYRHEPFLTVHRYEYRTQPVSVPAPTMAASGNHVGLLVPAGGTWRTGATSLGEPMPTRTTRDSDALLIPVEGRDGKEARSAGEVLRTMTTRNETGLLMPYYGTGQTRPVGEPIGTLTTRDRYAFVLPMRNNNTAKGIDEPFDTFAAAGNHHAMVTPDRQPVTPAVEDCVFRMLEPHEIAAGMAFPTEYRILGNKRERVRQAGNAVTPPMARDLGYAVAESLGVTA